MLKDTFTDRLVTSYLGGHAAANTDIYETMDHRNGEGQGWRGTGVALVTPGSLGPIQDSMVISQKENF